MSIRPVKKAPDRVPVRVVLASVFNKEGLLKLAQCLCEVSPGVVFLSTGGTHAELAKILDPSQPIKMEDYTGQPEMDGGLVKTLAFQIHAGLLAEAFNPKHQADLERMNARWIDMVIGNLYDFNAAIAKPDCDLEMARGHIDIGGPTMIRAAKNFLRLAVVSDPEDYPALMQDLRQGNGSLTLKQRFLLAQKVFKRTAAYDTAIANHLGRMDPDQALACYELVG